MRSAFTISRAVAGTVDDVTTLDIFNAATIGGARALLRDDIGRLKVGAKADLVLVDIKHPSMMPMREPLRSLLYVAADRAVRDVYVDGVRVVADGRASTSTMPLPRRHSRKRRSAPWARYPSSTGPPAPPTSSRQWYCQSRMIGERGFAVDQYALRQAL